MTSRRAITLNADGPSACGVDSADRGRRCLHSRDLVPVLVPTTGETHGSRGPSRADQGRAQRRFRWSVLARERAVGAPPTEQAHRGWPWCAHDRRGRIARWGPEADRFGAERVAPDSGQWPASTCCPRAFPRCGTPFGTLKWEHTDLEEAHDRHPTQDQPSPRLGGDGLPATS